MQRYMIAHAHEDAFCEEGARSPNNPFRQPLEGRISVSALAGVIS